MKREMFVMALSLGLGGTALSVVAIGLSDGAQAWCKQGRVVVASTKSSAGVVECVSVAGVAGNTTVEVSGNGQEFTDGSGVVVVATGGVVPETVR